MNVFVGLKFPGFLLFFQIKTIQKMISKKRKEKRHRFNSRTVNIYYIYVIVSKTQQPLFCLNCAIGMAQHRRTSACTVELQVQHAATFVIYILLYICIHVYTCFFGGEGGWCL